MKKRFIQIGIVAVILGVLYTGYPLLQKQSLVFGAPSLSYQRSLLPIDSTENVGTTTAPWDEGHFNEICLSADCKTVWPSGGGGGAGTWATTTSQVAGILINYPTTNTDVVVIGSNASTTAEWWYDPNISTGYLKGLMGIGTTSPYAPLSVVGQVVGAYFTGTTTASSTFGGGVHTSALRATGLSGCNTIDTTSEGYFICGTDETGTGSPFAWTPATNFNANTNSTTTPLWLRGTPFSLFASSTVVFDYATTTALSITDSLFIGGDKITDFVGTGLALSGTTLTTTLGTAIDISDETNLTAGDGLTLTGDDLDCDISDASTFGCLSAANFTTFNNKWDLASTSIAYQYLTLTNSILEADLKAVDAAGDEQILTFESTGGDFEWHTGAELCVAITGSADLCDGNDASGAGAAYPFTTATTYGTTTSATTTPLWLRGSLYSLFASSTSVFERASTTQLTIGTDFVTDFSSGLSISAAGVVVVNDVSADMLASADFGSFSCNGTTCTLDADSVNDTHIDWGTGANQVSIADLSGNQVSGALVWDFGGASSFEIVNDANPTVDATGEIAVNTTTASSSLRFYDGAREQALYPEWYPSYNFASSTFDYDGAYSPTASTTYTLAHYPRATTLMSLYCKVTKGTGNATIEIGTGSASSTIRCTTTATENGTDVAFTQRQQVLFSVGSAGTTAEDTQFTITAQMRIDAD